jgi:hypothetical protein
LTLVQLLARAFLSALVNVFYIMAILIAYTILQGSRRMEQHWLGENRQSFLEEMSWTLLAGIFVGLIASLALILTGIRFEKTMIYAMIPAVLAMLFGRGVMLLPIAAGAVLAVEYIWGRQVLDPASLLAMLGVLYLIRGLLIGWDGSRHSVPVYMKKSANEPTGAHVIQRVWPVPLMIWMIPQGVGEGAGGVAMPDWWPLFTSPAEGISLMLLPLAVVIGYGDVVSRDLPWERTRSRGLLYGLFGLIVTGYAILVMRNPALANPAIFGLPVLYFLLHWMFGGQGPDEVFSVPRQGIRVLDVRADSVGERMGIQAGDILLSLNAQLLNTIPMLEEMMDKGPRRVVVEVKRRDKTMEMEHTELMSIHDLGLILLPRHTGKFLVDHDTYENALGH